MSTLPYRSASLAPFFTPNGVAIVGASRVPEKLSYGVIRNLVDPERGYRGPIYPVNPKGGEVLGLACYPDIAAVPDPVELAVLIIPATAVPGAIAACGQRGIRAVVVIAGGFREIGPVGIAREREMLDVAERYGVRVMGPNGIGVIDTHTPLNTTFVRGTPDRGDIGFISQSGALCGGVIDWTVRQHIGFSRLLSVGNEADVNETDLIPFLAADDITRVIALYLEDVKGGPAFVDALRDASAHKPIVALKAGRTGSGQAATASHTGALAGVHAAFRAACKQTGVIEVESVQGLFNGALALAYQPLPLTGGTHTGDRIAIVTNAGGAAATAADALEAHGLKLARTSPAAQTALRGFLHPEAQVGGPVDMLGAADETQYRRALDVVLADEANDGVLAILVPQILVRPVAVVESMAAAARDAVNAAARLQAGAGKPVVACLMGAASLDEANLVAHQRRLPAYTFPEDAVAAFGVLAQRARWTARGAGGEASRLVPVVRQASREARDLIDAARAAGATALDAAASRALLEAYALSTPGDLLATSSDEAAAFAARVGFPVALKLASPDILHKSDIGGVLLDVADEDAARRGYDTMIDRAREAHPDARIRGVQVQQMIRGGQEVIIGVKRDPTFGPLVMFGLGGVYVEALADVSFRLAPLSPLDAEEMMAEVRSARILDGLRGQSPADRAAVADALVKVGALAAAHPEITELDINPLLALPAGQGAVAVDARVILKG